MEFNPKTFDEIRRLPTFEERTAAFDAQQAYYDELEAQKNRNVQEVLELMVTYKAYASDELATEIERRITEGCAAYDEDDEYGEPASSFVGELYGAVARHDHDNPDLQIGAAYGLLGAESNASSGIDEWNHAAFEATLEDLVY